MRKLFGFAAIAVIVLGASITSRAETFTAYLSPAQEVPAAASTGRGKAIVKLNAAGTSIDWTITFTGLTSAQTLSHIHGPAAVGVSAAVLINFGTVGGTSGTLSGTSAITPTQVAQLRSGLHYVNIHSVNFGGGELRGQLAKNRPVDYDGDGRTDPSVLRFPNLAPPAVAQITYWNLLSSGGSFAGNFGDANTDYPAPGDYDGDGKDDLCLYRDGATAGADCYFHLLNSSTNTYQAIRWGVSGDQPVARDYDGDGKTNVAIYRRGPVTGDQTYFYYRTDAGVQVSIPWGSTSDTATNSFGDTPVPADYDGDGKVDVAVYRFGLPASPFNNSYLIKRSSDNALQTVAWGNFNSDYILPGDFDGDGKADFCAARTGASGTTPVVWQILRTGTNTVTFYTFGISSDLPIQGDYDGDGKTDIAMRRGTGSIFYIHRSFDNTDVGIGWGQTGDFPVNSFDSR